MEGLLIWLPPRAALPADDVEQVASRVVAAAQALGDGERAEIGFPVKLGLRKVGEEGSYLSVAGGLSPHWARFTGQVVGQFQLDSSAIHRLSENPAEVTKLIDFIVLVANGIRAPGKMVEVDAEDTWVIERLPGLARPTLLVASPEATPDDGAAVRKALRAGTRRAADRVAATSAVLTILAFVGIYRSMESITPRERRHRTARDGPGDLLAVRSCLPRGGRQSQSAFRTEARHSPGRAAAGTGNPLKLSLTMISDGKVGSAWRATGGGGAPPGARLVAASPGWR